MKITRRKLFRMLAGLFAGGAVGSLLADADYGWEFSRLLPRGDEFDGFLIYEELRMEILVGVAHKIGEACADLIINGTGVDYPRGILRVEG